MEAVPVRLRMKQNLGPVYYIDKIFRCFVMKFAQFFGLCYAEQRRYSVLDNLCRT